MLFTLLFVGVALAVGVGPSSLSLPPGEVVIVEGAPPGADTISKAELDQEMLQYATLSGLKKVPRPGDEGYEQVRDEAMNNLILNVWVEIQAEELGVKITDTQIAKGLRESGETSLFREAHFTPKTLRERMKGELVSQKIGEKLDEQLAKPSGDEIRGYYEENPEGKSFAEAKAEATAAVEQVKQQEAFAEAGSQFRGEWQPRTHCAEGFVVERCSGYPAFAPPASAAACYEADPKQPAEGCPAPVPARIPALPGSVRPWKPQGDPLVQRPVP
ncbi:MAG: hypothetical protein ACTHK3_05465 [Solirubrobacterales bacterium]